MRFFRVVLAYQQSVPSFGRPTTNLLISMSINEFLPACYFRSAYRSLTDLAQGAYGARTEFLFFFRPLITLIKQH